MAEPQATILESLDQHGNGVRVEFKKQGDRFGHTIFSVHQGKATPLLRSVEGTPDDFSPPSPPFAELHQQGELLFFSGATTIGHWSTSVEAVEGRLVFDSACRLKGEATRLGNVYKAIANGLEARSENAGIVSQDPSSLCIVPPMTGCGDFPITVQWQYQISLSGPLNQ